MISLKPPSGAGPPSTGRDASGAFAIRVGSIDELFAPLDARPVAERSLREDVRLHLLDQWELVRKAGPAALEVHAPAVERSVIDEAAVGAAIHADLRAHTGRLRDADPLSRRDRIAAWVGVAVFLVTIAVSTTLDRISSDVLVAGVSQGIVVIGWVALWAPAERVVFRILPNMFARRRYAEFAEIEVRLSWHEVLAAHTPARPGTNSALEVTHDR